MKLSVCFRSVDKLLKKGESAWKSTKDAASSTIGTVASKTEKVTNTLADKTTSAVGSVAEATKETTASIIDNSAKLAKTTAEKSSNVAGKAWEGSWRANTFELFCGCHFACQKVFEMVKKFSIKFTSFEHDFWQKPFWKSFGWLQNHHPWKKHINGIMDSSTLEQTQLFRNKELGFMRHWQSR